MALPAIQVQSVLPSTGARNKTPAHSLLDEIVIFKALEENHSEVKKETETMEDESVEEIDLLDYSCTSDDEDESSESEESAPTEASALSNHTGKFCILTCFTFCKTPMLKKS